MNIFQASNITKRYSNHQALTNVSIDVPEGKIFGLLGPNGAGKTTLIRIINKITAQDNGTLLFRNRTLTNEDVLKIGYLPEERGLYKKMKVGEQAIYFARLKGISKQEAVKRLRYWFDKFDILPWWNKKVEELSKGMQQKVQFIITVLHKPELIIFDEPFSGFDPINTKMLKNEILNLRNSGTTIIFSTHNMSSVEEICDNIALINNSEKILSGSVNDIKQKFKSNMFECRYIGNNNDVDEFIKDKIRIIKHSLNSNVSYLKGEFTEKLSSNDFLKFLIQKNIVISFNDVIPSMDDIFIKVVNEDKQK